MLRRLLITLFVLASLASQASVAYACEMMKSAPVVLKHCCCKEMTADKGCDPASGGIHVSAGDRNCCKPVVDISAGPGDQLAGIAAQVKLPDHDPQDLLPVLLPALLAIALPVQSRELAWNVASDRALHGTDLYLRTQRLRL
jgi:hypothetical protein